MPDRSRLQRILALAFRMQDADVEALVTRLTQQRVAAWESEMARQAQQAGRQNPVINPPSGQFLAAIIDQSRRDAESIARTFNADFERRLAQMIEENALRNRYQWAAALNRWADERAVAKDREIALMTDGSARTLTRDAFVEINDLERYVEGRVVGPPPVCNVCSDAMSKGWVDAAYMRAVPMPNHVRCEHDYETRYNIPSRLVPELRFG